MKSEQLLRRIWQGDLTLADDREAAWIKTGFNQMIGARTVCVRMAGLVAPRLYAEGTELEPGLSLGDVLAEEIGLDMPYDTFVLVLPDVTQTGSPVTLSRDLGASVGEAILYASDLMLRIDRQTDAIYTLAHSAAHLAAARMLALHGVDPRAFCAGLGQSLGGFWRGSSRRKIQGRDLFQRPDFLWQSELRSYLTALDPCFTSPNHIAIPGDLLQLGDTGLDVDEWVHRLDIAVRSVLGHAAMPTPRVSGITSRFNLQ